MQKIDKHTLAYWTALCSQLNREAERLSGWKSKEDDGKYIHVLKLCVLTLQEADRRLNQICDIIAREIEDEAD